MRARNSTSRPKPRHRPQGHRPPGRRSTTPSPAAGGVWLWGRHAVLAALANPRRHCRRLLLADETAEGWKPQVAPLLAARADPAAGAEIVPRRELAALLPEAAVHQGIALLADALDQPKLADVVAGLSPEAPAAVLLLDQVSDPQNVGAILRSAAAFGAAALVTTRRNAPAETGALAKAASGALEHVPFPHEANLARAIRSLQDTGFTVLGLSGEAATPLAEAAGAPRTAVVLGAEGTGLRRLTRESCDRLVRLPTRGPISDLNVSNAAAITLYELRGRGGPA